MGWARERWTDNLFIKTLPLIAKEGLLKKRGQILLPYLNCIQDSLVEFEEYIFPYYSTSFHSDPKANSLYLATEDVEKELLLTPDTLTNETQVAPLLHFSDTPFVVLQLRDKFVAYTPPNSKSKVSKKRLVGQNSLCNDLHAEAVAVETRGRRRRS